MKHYLMLPQDTIRVLLPEDGQEACVELFCERVAIYFPVETLTVTHFTGVLVDKAREDALGLCGAGCAVRDGISGAAAAVAPGI